jgi:hypothetical protein
MHLDIAVQKGANPHKKRVEHAVAQKAGADEQPKEDNIARKKIQPADASHKRGSMHGKTTASLEHDAPQKVGADQQLVSERVAKRNRASAPFKNKRESALDTQGNLCCNMS